MSRPPQIVWFERLMIATLVLGAVNGQYIWSLLAPVLGPAFLAGVLLFIGAITLTLTLLISRRRSSLAKWIMIGMFVFGMPYTIRQIETATMPGLPLISALQIALQIVAYGLLFTEASRQWLKRDEFRG